MSGATNHLPRHRRPPFDTPVGKIAVLADPQGAPFSVIALRQQG